jgi:hypothetical protein
MRSKPRKSDGTSLVFDFEGLIAMKSGAPDGSPRSIGNAKAVRGTYDHASTLTVRPRPKVQARALLMNPNGGASLDAGPLSCGLHQHVDLLQVLERISARLQRFDASDDR